MRTVAVVLMILVLGLATCLAGPCKAPASGKAKVSRTVKAGPKHKIASVKSKPASVSKPKSSVENVAKPAEQIKLPVLTPAPVPDDSFTSLVIDATGLKLDRTMSPKILRADGSEVWGTLKNLTDDDYATLQDRGMVGYVTTLDESKTNTRCGARPLVIKALDTAGEKLRANPVISDDDAAKLLAENSTGKFLEKFNVILIRNETPVAQEQPQESEEPQTP